MSQTSLNLEGKKEAKEKYEKIKTQAVIPSMASVKTGTGLLESREVPRTSIQLPMAQSYFSCPQYIIPPGQISYRQPPQSIFLPQPISMSIPTGGMIASSSFRQIHQITPQIPQETISVSSNMAQQVYVTPEIKFPQSPAQFIQSQFIQQPPVYQIIQEEYFPQNYLQFSQIGNRSPIKSTQQILQTSIIGPQFTETPAIPTLESIISKQGEEKSLSQKIISMLEQVVNYSDQIPQEIIYEERLYELNGEVYLMPCITKIY